MLPHCPTLRLEILEVCLDCDGSILATTYQGLARWDWRVGEETTLRRYACPKISEEIQPSATGNQDRLCQEAAAANLADHCGLCASPEGVVASRLNVREVLESFEPVACAHETPQFTLKR